MASQRIFSAPDGTFFLLGPRATGKSTWIKDCLRPDHTIDLLKAKEFQRFSTNPGLIGELVQGNPEWKCIAIDEIQKLPLLLDEVHSAIFETKNAIRFVLTGSSARKLKAKNVNLLAGRALVRYFHPFSALEVERDFDLNKALRFGMLPQVWNLKTPEEKIDYLYGYVDTYLKEEIQQEAAVRSLPSYLKFLEHFALRNAQVVNIQNISRETGVPRTTINGYLDILEQTLLGKRLEPLQLHAKVKEVSTPKFYFFDVGVVRALTKTAEENVGSEKGFLFETLVLQELRLYSDYNSKRWDFYYWGTPSSNEVDFVVGRAKGRVGIEVKASAKWERRFNLGLETLLSEKKIKTGIGIYLGKEKLKIGNVSVYPFEKFLAELHQGKVF